MSDQLASIAVIGTVILLAVLGVLVAIFVASGRRDARRRRGEPVSGAVDRARVESEAESTTELRRRANASLVAIDDALRGWEQELGFAQAQFGPQAAAPLQAAIAAAKRQVTHAFALRAELDDAATSSAARAREVANEIIRICHEVTRDLDTHAHDFDSERAAQAHTPALLDELSRQGRLLGARSAAARKTLEALAHTYPAVALAAVGANPDLVDALADEAAASVATGRDALAQADRAAAAAAARAAQSAVDRATRLLDDVDQLPAQLQDAASHLDAAVAGLREEIARAEQLAPADPAVGSAASAASAVLAAQDARADGDPVEALRAVTQQRTELAAALATARERADRAEKARSRLTELVDQTNARIGAVTAYVETHRAAVGADARARLAAGVRHADEAVAQADGDPERALMAETTAARLVREAQALAEHDVAVAGGHDRQGTAGAPPNPSGATELALGGLLVDQLLRGHGRGLRGRGC